MRLFLWLWLLSAVCLGLFVEWYMSVLWGLIWFDLFREVVRPDASRRANLDRYYLVKTRWFGVFLHKTKKSETWGVFHTHPWSWFSIVLWGAYWDMRTTGTCDAFTTHRCRLVGWMNSCRACVAHAVFLRDEDKPVWTLCFRGPRRCKWEVRDATGKTLEVEPWTGTENAQRTEYV